MKKTIGLIGVGMMGHGIASSLQRHGHPLVLLQHAGNQPVQDLLAAGAREVSTAAQVAREAELVVLCVTGSAQVEAVMTSSDGVLAGLRAGTYVVDCSTSVPASTVQLASLVSQKGARMLDAAMTRTPKEAALGRLNLLVGGAVDDVVACRSVLECFAENITHVGTIGAGHRMKLLHNYVSLGMVTLLAEAAACAQNAQVDMSNFVQILENGGGRGVALDRLKPYLLENSTSGLSFSLANAVKDLGYYSAMAHEMGSDSSLADAILKSLQLADSAAAVGTLLPEVVRLIAQRSAKG
jgi:3-hydroxyisobutyrate dehydrogenase-like beta-hydroxyacid dehydrogenase